MSTTLPRIRRWCRPDRPAGTPRPASAEAEGLESAATWRGRTRWSKRRRVGRPLQDPGAHVGDGDHRLADANLDGASPGHQGAGDGERGGGLVDHPAVAGVARREAVVDADLLVDQAGALDGGPGRTRLAGRPRRRRGPGPLRPRCAPSPCPRGRPGCPLPGRRRPPCRCRRCRRRASRGVPSAYTRPSASTAARAAAGVCPKTFGTSRASADSPMRNSTVEPKSTRRPGAGSCSATLPSLGSPNSNSTGSPMRTTKPRSSRVARASSGSSPITLGTTVGTGPSEMTTVTTPSAGRVAPAAGSVSMT